MGGEGVKTVLDREKLKVGYAPLSQNNFDTKLAQEILEKSVKMLETLDNIQLVLPSGLIISESDAQQAVVKFKNEDIDLLLIQNCTFSFGGLSLTLTEDLDVPLVIWAVPEPPFDGGALRSNSLCATMMNSSILKKIGKDFKLIFGAPNEQSISNFLSRILKVVKAVKRLRNSKLALVGYRCPGFLVSTGDEFALQKVFGIKVHHIDLLEVFQEANGIPTSKVKVVSKKLIDNFSDFFEGLNESLEKTARVYLAIKQLKDKYNFDGIALKCWPEFPQNYGLAVCFAVSHLIDEGIMVSCEADINGLVTMLIEHYLTGEPVFFADVIAIDEGENTSLLWHCGAAPLSLADESTEKKLCFHQNLQAGITVEFPLKSGVITLSRLDALNNTYRMFVTQGKALKTPMSIRGNLSNVKFDSKVKEILETLISKGFPHHYAIVYKDIKDELIEMCHLLHIEPVVK